MEFLKKLYLGEKAAKKRFSIIRKLKAGKLQFGVYVICPASNRNDLLDIIPAYMLTAGADRDLTVVGLAASKQEAYEVCLEIVMDVYKKTSGYDIRKLL